jgi:uncharacterized tellurite resistance protein B-like protein
LVAQLGKEFDISENEFGELLDLAKHLGQDEGKARKLLGLVRNHFDEAQRHRILVVLWRIALADGKIDLTEANAAAAIRRELNLSIEQAVSARQMAEEERKADRRSGSQTRD